MTTPVYFVSIRRSIVYLASLLAGQGNGKKRHKKSASFAIWGLPHVQASLEQAEHHSTLFLCFAAYLWAVFGPIFGNSSLMSLQGRTLGMLAVCCRHSTKVNKATQMPKCFADTKKKHFQDSFVLSIFFSLYKGEAIFGNF